VDGPLYNSKYISEHKHETQGEGGWSGVVGRESKPLNNDQNHM